MNAAAKVKTPASRGIAAGLLIFASAIFGGNLLALRLIGRFFPLILACAGPLTTLGLVGLVNPRILDALFSGTDEGHPSWAVRTSMAAFVLGVALSLVILFESYYGMP